MTDKITQSAAIELLRAAMVDIEGTKSLTATPAQLAGHLRRVARDALAATTDVEAPTSAVAEPWISADDEWPEPGIDVLVRMTRGDSVWFDVAGIFQNCWMSAATEDETKGDVTHWKPLPKFPGPQSALSQAKSPQSNICPSCHQSINSHAWDCLFDPQTVDGEAKPVDQGVQFARLNRSTGFSCPECCAKAGDAHVEGCKAQATTGKEAK